MFWSVELSVLCCIMLLVVSTGHESTLCEIDNKCLDWLILVLWVFCTSRCNADIHNQLSTIHFLQWWEVSRHCLILRQYFHCLGLDTSPKWHVSCAKLDVKHYTLTVGPGFGLDHHCLGLGVGGHGKEGDENTRVDKSARRSSGGQRRSGEAVSSDQTRW